MWSENAGSMKMENLRKVASLKLFWPVEQKKEIQAKGRIKGMAFA